MGVCCNAHLHNIVSLLLAFFVFYFDAHMTVHSLTCDGRTLNIWGIRQCITFFFLTNWTIIAWSLFLFSSQMNAVSCWFKVMITKLIFFLSHMGHQKKNQEIFQPQTVLRNTSMWNKYNVAHLWHETKMEKILYFSGLSWYIRDYSKLCV